MHKTAWTLLAFIAIVYLIALAKAKEKIHNKVDDKLAEVERRLHAALVEDLSGDEAFTHGKIRQTLHGLHGILELMLWEKKADGTKVLRENDTILHCKSV